GFEIQTEKIQCTCPWTYLGLRIGEQTIVPQQLTTQNDPKTLQDLHQLCGSISWVHPLLGVTMELLALLFDLLKGCEDLDSPCTITVEAWAAISKAQLALSSRQAHRTLLHLPFNFIVLGNTPRFHGLIFQGDTVQKDPLTIIELIFLSHQPSKSITTPQERMAQLIMRARACLRTLEGCDFACIHLPLTVGNLDHLLQTNECLQFALDSDTGQVSVHKPKHKLFNTAFSLVPKSLQSPTPLKALTVLTDGSGASHKVMTWQDPRTQMWESLVQVVERSPQKAELAPVVTAFEKFEEPFNLVTDLACVAGMTIRVEHALLKEVANPKLYQLLLELIYLLSHREQPYHVMHVRSYTDLPGPIAEGNQRADALAMAVHSPSLPDTFAQAKLSHQFFHHSVSALIRMFNIHRDQAWAIVATCPICQHYQIPSLGTGVNPCSLSSGQLWQTDVTHVPQFGRLKYVQVSVDTFSGAIFAPAHAGEK
ncbi:POK11 protein, partial [Dryoscopus gambensis]|nr:POK11 protein [Dryoscopus gambensis]